MNTSGGIMNYYYRFVTEIQFSSAKNVQKNCLKAIGLKQVKQAFFHFFGFNQSIFLPIVLPIFIISNSFSVCYTYFIYRCVSYFKNTILRVVFKTWSTKYCFRAHHCLMMYLITYYGKSSNMTFQPISKF